MPAAQQHKSSSLGSPARLPDAEQAWVHCPAWVREHALHANSCLLTQEFVELVRAGDLGVAIRYARAHLAQWAEAYEAEHQRACALLAFSGATGCSRYAGLLDDRRWAALVRLFHGDLFRLHNMPPVSLLNVHLQVCALTVLFRDAHLPCLNISRAIPSHGCCCAGAPCCYALWPGFTRQCWMPFHTP